MKKILLLFLISILALISADSYAGWFQNWRIQRQQRQIQQVEPVDHKPVGVPLDGGLLIFLAAAGATYFGLRNKKKNLNE